MKLIFVVMCLFYVSSHSYAVEEQGMMPTLHVSSYQNIKIADRYKKLLTSAYNQLGYRIQFHEMVVGRALKMIEGNQLDALMVQTSALIDFEGLAVIKVPVLLGKGKLVLFCRKSFPCNKEVLDEPSNVILAPHGTLGAKTDFLKMNAATYEIATKEAAGKMFELGRFDYLIIIVEDSMGNLANIDEKNYKQVDLAPLEGFHYIHEKHKNLLPLLTVAIEKYVEQHEPSLQVELGRNESNQKLNINRDNN